MRFSAGAAYAEACAVSEEFADAAIHQNGPFWILTGRRSRRVSEHAVLHTSVRLRRERDPKYRPDVPDPTEPRHWADPDWSKPTQQ
ncbi:hypothetical protein OH809_38255 [Streptomyces sp. NBC_00873]|uniref:hypothetical protein n=1 Tax=unclassified Streptomyces TaxID=2593676 RepID=UPI00386F85DC|nr:hypothetical protein OH809_38255 [Streptomyces sp. NBC_00873]WTA42128.1 hypothetical protein OH821_05455 [Streptomyces sp. NBC_00842]